ncbi:hypothetical protein CRG98_014475 [Punica granatum]|uniref:Uncharacterized protein n=1 Tax=Punica granatum TaxID=22663 RepID=A0A2I0K9E2_PUNGR|nr:hypothetical protein CRG98_014475 [Punica granatum]
MGKDVRQARLTFDTSGGFVQENASTIGASSLTVITVPQCDEGYEAEVRLCQHDLLGGALVHICIVAVSQVPLRPILPRNSKPSEDLPLHCMGTAAYRLGLKRWSKCSIYKFLRQGHTCSSEF